MKYIGFINIKSIKVSFFTIYFCIFISIFSACRINSGDDNDTLKTCTEIDIKIPEYKHKSMDGYPEPDKRKISGYYSGDNPKLIKEQYYADSCRIITSYYFNDDEMIFVKEERYVYNKPISYTEDVAKSNNDSIWYDDKKTILQTSRFFFFENKLKKWVTYNRQEVPTGTPEFKKKHNELVSNGLLMIKMLKTIDN